MLEDHERSPFELQSSLGSPGSSVLLDSPCDRGGVVPPHLHQFPVQLGRSRMGRRQVVGGDRNGVGPAGQVDERSRGDREQVAAIGRTGEVPTVLYLGLSSAVVDQVESHGPVEFSAGGFGIHCDLLES